MSEEERERGGLRKCVRERKKDFGGKRERGGNIWNGVWEERK